MKKVLLGCCMTLALPMALPVAFAGAAAVSLFGLSPPPQPSPPAPSPLASCPAPSLEFPAPTADMSTVRVQQYAADASGCADATTRPTSSHDALAGLEGLAAVAYAEGQIGTPYEWGGERAGVGFDCSGLAQAAWRAAGVNIPRVAQEQFDAGPPVLPGEALEPGDLVFFGTGAADVTHVGIVVNPNGQMVDAPHTGAMVRLDSFPIIPGNRWGGEVFVGATRPGGAT